MVGKVEVGADETRKRCRGEYPQRLAKVPAVAVERIRAKSRCHRQPHNDKAPHVDAYLEQLSGDDIAALHNPERHAGNAQKKRRDAEYPLLPQKRYAPV